MFELVYHYPVVSSGGLLAVLISSGHHHGGGVMLMMLFFRLHHVFYRSRDSKFTRVTVNDSTEFYSRI